MTRLEQLKNLAKRKGINFNEPIDEITLNGIITKFQKNEALEDALKGAPDGIVNDTDNSIIELKHCIPFGNRTEKTPGGEKQARTFAVSKEQIEQAPKGTEFIVYICDINATKIPLGCNYPSLGMVYDSSNPLYVLRESIVIYNIQNGIRK